MNETAKKGILIAVAVLAVALLAWQFSKFSNSDTPQPTQIIKMPEGHKSEKEMFLEKQKSESSTPAASGGMSSEDAKDAALAGN